MTRIDSKFKKSFYLRLGRNFLGLTLQSIADELSEADSSSFVRIFFFFLSLKAFIFIFLLLLIFFIYFY